MVKKKEIFVKYSSTFECITKKKEFFFTNTLNIYTLYCRLSKKYIFPFHLHNIKILLNGVRVDWHERIHDGDEITFELTL